MYQINVKLNFNFFSNTTKMPVYRFLNTVYLPFPTTSQMIKLAFPANVVSMFPIRRKKLQRQTLIHCS